MCDVDEECDRLLRARDLLVNSIDTYTSRHLSSARSRHNSLISIYRLPNEVLVLIFQNCIHSTSSRFDKLQTSAPFNISQVSKRWRDITFSTPALWTKIDIVHGSLVDDFISRSKSLPLDVELECGEDDDRPQDKLFLRLPPKAMQDRFMQQLRERRQRDSLSHIVEVVGLSAHRLRSLKLSNCPTIYSSMLPLPAAPILEILHIESPDIGGRTTISSHVAHGDTPRLRELTVIGMVLPLNPSLYKQLTSLHLERIDFRNHDPIESLVRAVHACPDLEHLNLAQLQFFISDVSQQVHHMPVNFPKLRDLEFSALSPQALTFLLHSIISPPRARFSLNLTPYYNLEDDIPSLMTRIQGLSCVRILHIVEFENGEGSFAMAKGYEYTGGPELLSLTFQGNFFRVGLVVNNLKLLLPLHLIEELTLEYLEDIGGIDHLLNHPMSALTTLTFNSCNPNVIEVLIRLSEPVPGLLLCPRLSKLRLGSMDLGGVPMTRLCKSDRGMSHNPPPGGQSPVEVELLDCTRVSDDVMKQLEKDFIVTTK